MTRDMGSGEHDHSSRGEGGASLSPEKISRAYYATRYPSIQAAVDAIPTMSQSPNTSLGKLIIPPVDGGYAETVDFGSTLHGSVVEGYGHATYLHGSGDHTVDVTDQDVVLKDLWVDNEDANTYDAVNAFDETELWSVDIDAAGRHAINANAKQVRVHGSQVVGDNVGGSGLFLGASANQCRAVGFSVHGATGPQHAVEALDGSTDNQVEVYAQNTAGDAVILNGINAQVRALIGACGDRGVEIGSTGAGNFVQAVVQAPTNEALYVDGANNLIVGYFNGDVTLSANSSDNVVVGWITSAGTITDNGTNNDTTNLHQAM